jgi:CBS domain-containing protein
MIVDSYFTPSVVFVRRSACLQEAAAIMRSSHVGALVVIDDKPDSDLPVGIVTDRDLVIKGMADGLSSHGTTVGDIMTPALATVLRSDTLQHALELMRTRGVRRLAVGESDGRLAGIISFDDVVDALGAEFGALHGIVRNEIAREIAAVSNVRATGAERT